MDNLKIVVNLKLPQELDTIFKKRIKQKSEAVLVKTLEIDDVTGSKLINAAILKLIKISNNCPGRYNDNNNNNKRHLYCAIYPRGSKAHYIIFIRLTE